MKFFAGLLAGACALLLSSCAEYYAYETGYGGAYAGAPVAIQSATAYPSDYGGSQYSSPIRPAFPLNHSYARPVYSSYGGRSCNYDRGRNDYGGGYRRPSYSSCDAGGYY